MRRGRRHPQHTAPATTAGRHLTHPFTPQKVFSDDRIAAMHDLALKVLEELGMKILLPEAREIFARAGARVADEMVFIGRDIVAAALESAPRRMMMKAPNPAHSHEIASDTLLFTPGGGCPNVFDRVNGRRPGDLTSYKDALRLAQHFDVLHKLTPAPEPQDIPVHLRHFAMMQAQLGVADKAVTVYGRGRAQVQDCFEILQLALNLGADEFDAGSWASTVVNTNSPRMLDKPMAQAVIDFARANQIVIVTPFCLAGAMAPVTVAGALVLQHAEALACIALSQLARAGAPVLYGGFGSNVDMKSGSPAFGTPEHIQMQIGSGQLARHIGLPWRSATGTAANTSDAQAAGETHMGLWGALMAGANLVVHSAGWLEGGLTLGFEKLVLDVEALGILAHLCTPPDASDEALGFDAIAEVAPGGHFFDNSLTMARYQNAFLPPLVADLSNFGTWEKNGSQRADERATGIWQDILRDYTAPAGCAERLDRIAQYVADRTAAGGAPIVE
ncbi:trimethylamine methyltransferase family protein [Marimonas lutisalis]|uniref:trimethylamine methyltransferase family protein n=1 Tax=Marimonas lutisalis TaxID=2545756 RepID=UPI0010FA3EE6|nr:trimethylamine methyltransferase family protein [Marimonas lutisalis]